MNNLTPNLEIIQGNQFVEKIAVPYYDKFH
jgi:hypothetical protein